MSFPLKAVIVALCCALVAWVAGPAGRLLVIVPLLLFGPGYLFERSLHAFDGSTLAQRPAIWLGLSISLIALLYEWATALGLSLGQPALTLLAAVCGMGVIWRILRTPQPRLGQAATAPQLWLHRWRWQIALLLVFLLTLWTRFNQIRDLVLPAWVDSVHHALMIRVAAERGQVPYSLRPYLPIDQLSYHWGYHVLVAAMLQISGLALPQTMLWVGQILNSLQVLAVAALTASLWRRPLAGVVAGIIVGLISIMPAYYVSWGRYTQLTGLLLLPPLVIAWKTLLARPSRGRLACAALLLAGLSMVHFRILLFAILYMFASAAIVVFQTGTPKSLIPTALAIFSSAVLALALTMPWQWVLVSHILFPAIEHPQDLTVSTSSSLTDGLLWAGYNSILIALALAAGYWQIRSRKGLATELAGWIAAATVLVNPSIIGLPSTWVITIDVLVITLFMPLSIYIGGGVSLIIDQLQRTDIKLIANKYKNLTLHIFVSIVLISTAIWGTWNLRDVVNPSTILAKQDDLNAFTWIAEHTAPTSRFLVGVTPWLDVNRGSDGGWWLLPLEGRWVNVPPVIYTYAEPTYIKNINQINKQILALQPTQTNIFHQILISENISYLYITSNTQFGKLALTDITSAPFLTQIYHQGDVTILAVQP